MEYLAQIMQNVLNLNRCELEEAYNNIIITYLYDLPTEPGHAPDEVADGLLSDLVPDLVTHSKASCHSSH